jgi:hypothetical protein
VTVPAAEWYTDTDPRALGVFLGVQREMSVSRKIETVLQMSEMIWRLPEANVRRLHPDASDREVFLRTAARRLDREAMTRVYGWDPLAAEP